MPLGINADFVKPGTIVTLDQAKTGQSSTTGGSTGGTSGSGGTSGGSTSGNSTVFEPGRAGIAQSDWDKMSVSQRALIESAWKTASNQYDSGVTNVSINTKLLNDAMKAAENDPEIRAKYGNALITDKDSLTKSLASANTQWAQDMGLLDTRQQQERKAQDEAQAQAGLAFSGFRQQAKQRLGAEQSGVIASSRRNIQNNLNETGRNLEQKYGSSGLGQFGNLAIGDMTYNPLGGLTSTQDVAQKADILNRGTSIYNLEKTPLA